MAGDPSRRRGERGDAPALIQPGLGAEDELQWAKKHLDCPGRVGEFNVIDGMWNARVTSHVPLREVADLLTIERIVESIAFADVTLRAAGFDSPRIAVAALNPHAGGARMERAPSS